MPKDNDDFAERLAAATATPGGGAAAARAGRHACALLRMVTGLTLAPRAVSAPPAAGEAPFLAAVRDAALRAERLEEAFATLETEDIAAFTAYLAALRLPRSTPAEKAERQAARGRAAARATEVPLGTLRAALDALRLAGELLDLSRASPLKAESDLGVSIELAAAAFRAAEMNVWVNLPEIPADRKEGLASAWEAARREFDGLYPGLRRAVVERLGGR
jgi:formiminotetrahydrofolate cyclodeaminase